jgi:hypothetical protein
MNLLIIKRPNKFWINIAKELTDLKKVLWVGTSDDCKHLNNLTHSESLLCNKKIKIKKKVGLNNTDLDLINENYTFLNDILNRYTVDYDKIYFENKRRYIIDCYEYWKEILISYPINKVISKRVPHRFYDNLIYIICKNYKIPIIFTDNTTEIYPVENNLQIGYFFTNDLNFKTSLFKKKITKKSQKLAKEYISLIRKKIKLDLRPNYFKNNINKQSSLGLKIKLISPKLIIYFYLFLKSFFTKKREFKLIFEKKKYKVRSASNYEILLHNYACQIKLQKYINFYSKKSLNLQDIKNKKFIYLSLSRDFEKTICPDGKFFKDVNFILDYMLYFLPKNYFLVIKEHPSCMKINNAAIINRSKKFLENIINKSKKIILMKEEEDQASLISQAKGVVTLTGTAAWEAALLGKTSAIFGTSWYERLSSINCIKNTYDYQKFVNKISYTKNKNNLRNIYKFLCNLYENIYQKNIFETDSDDIQKNRKLIVNELQKKTK